MTGRARRILFLNNTANRAAIPPLLERELTGGAELESCWAAQGQFPDDIEGYAGAVISGSPHSAYDRIDWIEREHEVIRELADRQVPMLGICFGSQILASALLGRDQVYRRSDCEVGFKWLEVTEQAASDAVCGGLNDRIRMFVWHNDDVRSGHRDMEVMAKTDACANQIWRHRRHPAWGVQGHLEITLEEAPAWFSRNRSRLEADAADVDRLIAEAEEAETAKTIISRFLAFSLSGNETAPSARGRAGS